MYGYKQISVIDALAIHNYYVRHCFISVFLEMIFLDSKQAENDGNKSISVKYVVSVLLCSTHSM